MVEAAGVSQSEMGESPSKARDRTVEPASEMPKSHEIRRLPVTHRRVSCGLSLTVNPKMFTTYASWSQPTYAAGFKNVREEVRISSLYEHWGSRSPQTSSLRLLPER